MLIVVILLPWLHIQGRNTETKIEDIKNFLSDHGQMAWVEYPKNATEVGVCCLVMYGYHGYIISSA